MAKPAVTNMTVNYDYAHPRYTEAVLGHTQVVQDLQRAWSQKQFPHGIILSGPKGVGKATLAYQITRRLLDTSFLQNFDRATLDKPCELSKSDHLIRAQNHPDLLVLEKEMDEKGKISKEIPIDKARSIVKFFSRTSLTDGWRVAIIDAIDDLSTKGANTLLKILEEPPQKCLLILISHNQAGVLPTLTSRCQLFSCHPLPQHLCQQVLKKTDIETPDIYLPSIAGAPGLAYSLRDLGGEAFLDAFTRLTISCKQQDFRTLQSFLDRYIFKPDILSPDQAYFAFCRFLQTGMAHLLTVPCAPESPLRKTLPQRAASWFSLQDLLKQSHTFALDRKQTLMCVFYDFYGYHNR